MRNKYKNLNEQISRMKSIFSDERLYGNLINKKIVSEQRRLFNNISDAFNIKLKSFDELGNFNKFINSEINNVDDIIKNVDDYEDLWKRLLPNVDFTKLKRNLVSFNSVYKKGNLNKIPEDVFLTKVINAFPEKGGMRDVILDMWLESNGRSRKLPSVSTNKIAKIDPTTKELVIGTKGEKGVITYKNKEGKVTLVEKDPNYKPEEKSNGETQNKEDFKDIEDVDFIEVTEGTPLDNLNGKKVTLTEELIDSLDDKIKEGTGSGNFVKFTIIGEGEEGIKAAKEMMDTITKGKSESDSVNFVPEKPEETIVDNSSASTEVKEELKNSGLLKKLFTEYPTKYILNPTTYLPKEEFLRDAASRWNRRGYQILFRVGLDFTIYEYLKTPEDSTFIRQATGDLYKLLNYLAKESNLENTPSEFIKGVCDGIESSTKDKQFCYKLKNTLKNKIETNFKSKLENENICSDLMSKNNNVIIKELVDKTTEESKTEIMKSLENKFSGSKLFSLEEKIKKVSNYFLTNDNENEELNKIKIQMLSELDKKRISCLSDEAKKKALENEGLKEVEVTVVNPEQIQSGLEKEIETSGDENSSGGSVKIDKEF